MLQVLANGLIVGCAYALVGFGFGLIYNTTRTFHFAHAAVYSCSIYLWYSLSRVQSFQGWMITLIALVATALIGIAIDEFVYQPLVKRKSSLLILLLSSLGVQIVIVNIIVVLFGNEVKVLDPQMQPTILFMGIVLSRLQVITVLCSVLVFTFLAVLLRKTQLGKMVRAMREDPELVTVLGINPVTIRRFVFGLGSMLAGIAGILKGLDVGTEPNAGMVAFLSGAVAVIIGGIGVFEGAIAAALLLGVIQSVVVWTLSGQWHDAVTFLLLILFLLFRPEGIFGRQRRIEESAA